MRTFLQDVANSLLQQFGNNMSNITVVFPGKRAGLFLNQALVEQSVKPIWAPRYLTISEFFQELSDYELCDPIEAVCLLYEIYSKEFHEPLTLDQFYNWGELMLADFDDVDKHLVDASQLFQNIYELKEMDDITYISDKQERALRSFFADFSKEKNTVLKERFVRVWSKMLCLYSNLQSKMKEQGVLYEGALQRDVIEKIETCEKFNAYKYVFVGFNVLNKVEENLFHELKSRNQALFYWDYDVFYTSNSAERKGFYNEAGFFISHNIELFGNALSPDCFDHLQQKKDIHFISATSENIQASYMTTWVKKNLTNPENKTAVVLCNEQLLEPVLQAIPAQVKAKNLTMGYPLSDTPIYDFISVLLDFVTDGFVASKGTYRPRQLKAVMSHPFSKILDESVWKRVPGKGIATLNYLLEILTEMGKYFNAKENKILTREAVFQCYKTISRLRELMNKHQQLLQINALTLRRLVLTTLRSQSVPFHGEPAVGLQVMGVLETRCLDFDHLLMLNVGEGFLPKKIADVSLIPYVLKESYGLSTVRHKIAVYAYYFYRLISRASHITFVYNESNSGLRQNEISRFLRQMMAETDWPITFEQLQADNRITSSQPEFVEKTPEMVQQLLQRYENTEDKNAYISAKEFNTYTTCPLSYYYRYVRKIKTEIKEEEGINAMLLGILFHTTAELVYKYLSSVENEIRVEDIEALLDEKNGLLEGFITKAFEEKLQDTKEFYSEGVLKLIHDIIKKYLLNMLKQDRALTPFRYLASEEKFLMNLEVSCFLPGGASKRTVKVCVGGVVDRVDEIIDVATGKKLLRVVDYKTGTVHLDNVAFEDLFKNTLQQQKYYFQALLYALTVSKKNNQRSVIPALYFLRNTSSADFKWKLTIDKQPVEDVNALDCNGALTEKIKHLIIEMLDTNIPYRATTNSKACEYCDYKLLCGK